ncbi:MAG: CPBP family glutamic-type intramembrane protease [Anaerolineae bacterium]
MRFSARSLPVGVSPLFDALLFVVVTIALSWLFWAPAALLQANGATEVANVLFAIGSFAPLAVAVYLNLWARRRMFEWGRWLRSLRLNTILVALVLPVLILIPMILWRLYDQTFDLLQLLADLRGLPLLLLGLFILAFGEEVGWRGFMLARLERYKLVLVNGAIALAWFVWQIPRVLADRHDVFLNDGLLHLAAFLSFSMLITPFLNRMALRSDMNVFLPALLRASLNAAFSLYALQQPVDLRTYWLGTGMLVWLVILNVLLFGQLWLGRPAQEDSELARVMPLEPAIK